MPVRKSAVRWHAALSQFLAAALLVLPAVKVQAQQLEPRAYSASPVGLNFVGVGTTYSNGGVVTDPTLLVTNAHAIVDVLAPYYLRTFSAFGRLASASVAVPYGWGVVHGDVQEVSHTVDRSGLLDPQLRFSLNLLGSPALTPREFSARTIQRTLGASLTINVPSGQYDGSKVVNLGTNRWAFKPELGYSQPLGNWIVEFYAGVWLFQANDDFMRGQVRKQGAMASYQTHIVYAFRPNLWASADLTYYVGGSTTVNGQPKDDRQDNSRGGLTLSVPVGSGQSLKFTVARGVSVRAGSDFETIGIVWQYRWL